MADGKKQMRAALSRRVILGSLATTAAAGVGSQITALGAPAPGGPPLPRRIIDLSPTITEDLPVRIWGHKNLADLGFSDTTEFRVIRGDQPFYYSNSYYTLFNHGGPHVDGPNHLERGAPGVDSYNLESLVGPIRLIDVRGRPLDEPITIAEVQRAGVRAGDIAMVLTDYRTPGPTELPKYRAVSKETAEYLARLPIKAFATSGLSVDFWLIVPRPYEQSVHQSFLSRRIPAIEQLQNVEQLVGVQNAVFVGLPLKVKDGDGSPIRAAAFVY